MASPSRPDLEISSPANPRLKQLVGLRRRRVRDEAGVTVVEGFEELGLALDAGVRPRTLFYAPDLMLDPASQLAVVDGVRASGVETVKVSRSAFEKVAYREGPDGFLALVPAVSGDLADLRLPPAPLLLVCEGLEKPGNLGAMLRTAEAAGVDAVVAVDPVTDWGNPNVVRSSKGTVFSVPVASATLGETVAWLRGAGIRLVATTPDTDTLHTEADLTGGVAIVVGTEKFGLTDEALRAADVRVRIPMHGNVNSLNASAAAAIVVYEAVRQRSASAQVTATPL
jgi:TrmH family RNA methyltransferase